MEKMVKRYLIGAFTFLSFIGFSQAIDEALAKKYNAIFGQMTQETLAKSPYRVTPKQVINMIKKGEDIVLLDIRTEAEQSIVGLTYKNSFHIPMDKLFKPENLSKIPKDKKVIVVCHSGVRAIVATFALRSLGFKNVYALKGGIAKLAHYVTPKTTLGIK
ncbi:MAG TPA: rhodanese-like domain-containing protein [Aquifex aeolicus]|nr:rhodanese-like domain-containing protein [Aquifex aeolicus]